jgi:hypothetical protein
LVVKNPDDYRALAADALRDAEIVPGGLRLHLIIIAQHWLDLADKVARFALRKRGQSRPNRRGMTPYPP